MKKLLSLIGIILLAVPVLAQDDIVLSSAEIDALLGGGNRGNRGNQNNNQAQIPDPVYMFEDLKALLKNNKVALDKTQEKALQAFLNTETVAMRTALEAQFSNRGNNPGNRGNNNQVNMITDLTAGVTKHNAELLTEIKAALTPDQVSLVTKAEKDKKACTVILDLINFQELQTRLGNSNNGGGGGGRGGPGGFEGGGFEGGGFDFPGGGGGDRGGGGRGGNNNNAAMLQILPNRASCTSRDSTPAQRLAVLGDLLTKGKKPLTADQATKFTPLIEARMKTILDELKAKDPQIDQLLNSMNQNRNNQNQAQTQPQAPQVNVQTLTNNIVNTIMQNLGIQNQPNNNNNNRGGGRGNQPNNNQPNANATANANANANANNAGRGNNQQNFNPQAEIQKKNEELFDKVAAMLKPEQQPFVKKVKYDQIKAKGGVDRYRGILEQEGTPLTPEQLTQILALINTSNTAVRNFAQTLVTTEITALAPGALQAAALQYQQQQQQLQQQQENPQQNRNNNAQLNNVNQNTVAQQIVGKVLPQVSVQRGRLEKAASDSILRVMTPAQQASYKVSQMN